jgi:hypothetical protein
MVQNKRQLSADLRKCTETYGYSPRETSGLKEHELAPYELEWNQCAYRAVGAYEGANPALAPMYSSLINFYRMMTDEVTNGSLTPSQRLALTNERLQEIQQAENAQNCTGEPAAGAAGSTGAECDQHDPDARCSRIPHAVACYLVPKFRTRGRLTASSSVVHGHQEETGTFTG